jgi:2-(1,2-epoxy-1,2-dihydrophenyl)acetyl-CoA isomerase
VGIVVRPADALPSYRLIRLELRDGILIATLNRPEKLNAFNPDLRSEFISLLNYVAENQDSLSALIITGAGRAFCSGADVGEWVRHVEEGLELDFSWTADIVEAFLKINIPVVIGLNGLAIGLGFNLLLWADYVVASREVKLLSPPFLKWGLSTGLGSSILAPLILGFKRAKQVYLRGENIGLEEAVAIGLVDKVVEPEKLIDECVDVARRLSSGSMQAVREIKRLLTTGLLDEILRAVREEIKSLNSLAKTDYFKERVRRYAREGRV